MNAEGLQQRLPEEQAPAQVPTASEADLLSRASETITRIRARLLAARAAARAPEAGTLADEPFLEMMNFAGPTRLHLQQLQQGESTKQLFAKPVSQLTPTELDLKRLTVNNLQRLMDIENALSQLEETKNEKRANNCKLMKEWESVCGELNERMDFRSDAESEKSSEDTESAASQLAKLARKTEKMRNLIERFIIAPTNYDFLEDKDDLLSLLPVIREPYTVDRMLSEIAELNET